MRPPAEDRSVPLVVAPSKFCPRKLGKPDGPNVKRYMSKGPLAGYMIACPACGFTEMHMEERAGYVEREVEGQLVLLRTNCPVPCMFCGRLIQVVLDDAGASLLSARTPPAIP